MALDQAFQHGSTPNITWLLSDQDREVAVDDNGNPCHKYSHPFCGFVSREDDLDAANPNYRHQYCYSWRTTPFDEARVLCKSYWCRYFPRARFRFGHFYPPNYTADKITCPGLEDAGCPTEWGYTYTQGRRTWTKSTHDLVPSSKMKHSSKTGKIKITCNSSGETTTAFCRPIYQGNDGPQPSQLYKFEWQGGSPPDCPGPGQGWAEWTQWSGNADLVEILFLE